MNTLDYLVSETKSLLGATVTGATLLIWPDRNGREQSDTQLNLTLTLTSGKNISITLRTDPDGQTPLIENEDVEADYRLAQLLDRSELWAGDEFWESPEIYKYETFDLAGSDEFKGVVGSEIFEIGIFFFDDEEKSPTGVKIKFSSNAEIWSVPGTYGNVIRTELRGDWFEERVATITMKV